MNCRDCGIAGQELRCRTCERVRIAKYPACQIIISKEVAVETLSCISGRITSLKSEKAILASAAFDEIADDLIKRYLKLSEIFDTLLRNET